MNYALLILHMQLQNFHLMLWYTVVSKLECILEPQLFKKVIEWPPEDVQQFLLSNLRVQSQGVSLQTSQKISNRVRIIDVFI